MAQINLHTTPEFEAELAALMKGRGIKTKSEAIRLAVHEAAAPYAAPPKRDLSALIGMIGRLPGPRLTDKTGAELEAEIDDEMEAALERLSRRR
jgi:hypothetical protein